MTFDCDAVPEATAELLGGETTPARHEALTRHLATCSTCAARDIGIGEILVQLRTWPEPDPGPAYWLGFAREVGRRLDRDGAPLRPSPWRLLAWLRPAAAAAALAAVTVLRIQGPAAIPAAMQFEPSTALAVAPHDVAALARALDRLGPDGPFVAAYEALDSSAAASQEPWTAAAASADVFAFLDATAPLDAEQTQQLLAALESQFAG